MTQAVDHVAVLPAYLAVGTAVLVLLADLLVARRRVTVTVAAAGAAATALGAVGVGWAGPRATFCGAADCSYLAGGWAALVAAVFALLTLGVIALSAPMLRAGQAPAGEYCFLLACSMTGGVVLGAAGDLVTLVVALETLTLPLYVLVGLRHGVAGAEAAVTFFVVSVVATAVTLLGAALLYAATGAVHLRQLAAAFAGREGLPDSPLGTVAVALVVLGLAFKVAAVPLHAWAPPTYDGAPVPVAAYLSTASKFGGVVALLAVTAPLATSPVPLASSTLPGPLPAMTGPVLPAAVTGPVFAVLAVLTMTVGNLVALRQDRMVRLLAWSSVAQAGYVIAPFGALAGGVGGTEAVIAAAVAAAITYTLFYLVMEFSAFAAVVAFRPAGDGGSIRSYQGAARRSGWVGAAFTLALVGLAGLPPGLAGMFAKVAVVRGLLDGQAAWLAVVVALNAVLGLAYCIRVVAVLYSPALPAPSGSYRLPPGQVGAGPPGSAAAAPGWPVAAALAVATLVAVVVGFAPQLVLDAAQL